MRKTLRWLQQARADSRYQLIAHDALGHLLLDLERRTRWPSSSSSARSRSRATPASASGAPRSRRTWPLARSRLGQTVDAAALAAALEQTRRMSERYLLVRCLDVAAEIALASGDADGCAAHADELLAIAEPNALRELEAVGRRWRGEALLARREPDAARTPSWRAPRPWPTTSAACACSATRMPRWRVCIEPRAG